ncbi:MAG: hypothetical protein V1731_00815 [Candidatus Aenigmatarchaeota archaeon]
MAIDMVSLAAPAAIGATTGFLVVFLVLKKFPMMFKLKIAIGGFLSALIVAALYFISQSIIVGVVIGTAWAFMCLWVIAGYGAKNMPDIELDADPLEMVEQSAGNLAGMMLAIIVFVLGAASTLFDKSSDKFTLIAFSAPPLVASLALAVSVYFATKYGVSKGESEKQYNAKKSLTWWDIGQTIFIATIIAIIIFVAMMIEKIVA